MEIAKMQDGLGRVGQVWKRESEREASETRRPLEKHKTRTFHCRVGRVALFRRDASGSPTSHQLISPEHAVSVTMKDESKCAKIAFWSVGQLNRYMK